MKILSHSASFAQESTGIGNYICEVAAWLIEQWHEVQAMATSPYYLTWQLD